MTETTNGHKSVAFLDQMVQDFPYRFDEGKAPWIMKVRPYSISMAELDALDMEVADAQDDQDQLKALRRKDRELETRLILLDSDAIGVDEQERLRLADQAEEIRQQRVVLQSRMEDLGTRPRPVEIIADKLFVRVIVSWPLTRCGEEHEHTLECPGDPVPLSIEGIATLHPLLVTDIRDQLTSFLSLEKRRKRKK